MPKRRRKSTGRLALDLLIKVLLICAIGAALLHYVLGIHVNHDNNMYPAIRDGDLCITYKLDRYIAEEAVAYRLNGVYRLGRIVALEGDVVDITDTGLSINGNTVSEQVVYATTDEGAEITFPYIVEQGCVFILNDFRSDVQDSRSFGAIPIENLDGKLVLMLRRRGF